MRARLTAVLLPLAACAGGPETNVNKIEPQLAVAAVHAVLERDEHAERGRGQVLDIAEHDDDLRPELRLRDLHQLHIDLVDVQLVEDVPVHEVDAGDAV